MMVRCRILEDLWAEMEYIRIVFLMRAIVLLLPENELFTSRAGPLTWILWPWLYRGPFTFLAASV